MRQGRTQIIWVTRGGTGKVRTALVSPALLNAFFLVVFMGLSLVPFLEVRLVSLRERAEHLEQAGEALQAELLNLQYVRRSLTRIEEKERRLRDHFGVDRYKALQEIMGVGGDSGPNPSAREVHSDAAFPSVNLAATLKKLVSNHEILAGLTLKQGEAWERTPSIMPVDLDDPRISSEFGWRHNPMTNRPEFHAGVDILGPKGTRIIAPAAGWVVGKGCDQWLGNYVVVQHTKEIRTIYGHLDSVAVNEGAMVRRGHVLGYMGNTGFSTSRHLHYAVVLGDRAVDPMQYVLDMKG